MDTIKNGQFLKRDRFLPSNIICDRLDISLSTFYRLVRAGAIRAYRIGKAYKVKESEIEAFLQRNCINN